MGEEIHGAYYHTNNSVIAVKEISFLLVSILFLRRINTCGQKHTLTVHNRNFYSPEKTGSIKRNIRVLN